MGIEANGMLAGSAKLAGTGLSWSGSDKIKAPAGGPYSVSMWIKPTAAQGSLYSQGALQLNLDGGKLIAKLGTASADGGAVAASTWSYVALTYGSGKLTLYVNGAQTAQVDAGAGAAIEGGVKVATASLASSMKCKWPRPCAVRTGSSWPRPLKPVMPS